VTPNLAAVPFTGAIDLHDVQRLPLGIGADLHQPQKPDHAPSPDRRKSRQCPPGASTPNFAAVPAKFPCATRQHRLFAFITRNWRGKPLVSHQVIMRLIGAATTETGLKVCREIDCGLYPRGVNVPDEKMLAPRIEFHTFPRRVELYHLAATTALKQLFLLRR